MQGTNHLLHDSHPDQEGTKGPLIGKYTKAMKAACARLFFFSVFVFQVYYMCNSRGGGRGFLCPQGTKFDQRTMVCDFAKKVKCHNSSNYFHRNVIIHQASLAATKQRRKKNLTLSGNDNQIVGAISHATLETNFQLNNQPKHKGAKRSNMNGATTLFKILHQNN